MSVLIAEDRGGIHHRVPPKATRLTFFWQRLDNYAPHDLITHFGIRQNA